MKSFCYLVIVSLSFGFFQKTFAQQKDTINSVFNEKIKQIPVQEYTFSDGSSRSYPRPKWLEMITKVPKDVVGSAKNFVQKDHSWYLGGSLLSTALLIPVDQQITDKTRAWSNNIGLSSDNRYGKFGPLQNIPQNIGAGFYLFGNGTTVIIMSAGFASYGLIKNDYRAQSTASQLMESLLVSGVFVQTLKRISGRESPFIARENNNPGGDWNPFPSFAAYAKETPHYDAIPSGHLTTIFAALTIIATNYPEYKWIKPLAYTLLGGLCFQMVQSEVHWVSDYPIAVFMGYFIGKTIAKNRFTETKKVGETTKKYSINFSASKQYGVNSLGIAVKF
jgi:membrane-associated phospholipid phosphatase